MTPSLTAHRDAHERMHMITRVSDATHARTLPFHGARIFEFPLIFEDFCAVKSQLRHRVHLRLDRLTRLRTAPTIESAMATNDEASVLRCGT